MSKPSDFCKSDKHLPGFLKEFHDQKDFFKVFQEWVDTNIKNKTKEHSLEILAMKGYNWVDNHILIIDYFLWYLALHGYKLHKIRSKTIEFYDIDTTIKDFKDRMHENFKTMLSGQK